MMYYIVFDLDETLAELYSTYYFVDSLRPEYFPNNTSNKLKEQLVNAYTIFVKRVLTEEESLSEPLGILRPGILSIFEEIQRLKILGLIGGVAIYSNNGHLQSLEFIRDLIHRHLNVTDLIQECIHWGHSMRKKERGFLMGAADKTWKTLSSILKGPTIKAPSDLSPSSVYFFDDQFHPDLKKTLDENYIQVPSYNFKASFNTLAKCYTDAINEALINKESFIHMNSKIYGKRLKTYDDLLEYFRLNTNGTEKNPVSPEEDNGIILMKNILNYISNSNSDSLHIGGSSVSGVKRKRRTYKTQKNIKKRLHRGHNTRKK